MFKILFVYKISICNSQNFYGEPGVDLHQAHLLKYVAFVIISDKVLY